MAAHREPWSLLRQRWRNPPMNLGPERMPHRALRLSKLGEKLLRVSEVIIVSAAGLLVIAAVILATIALYALFIRGLHANFHAIESIDAIQTAVQNVFAGVLL